MKYRIINKLTPSQISQLHKLYKKEWWTNQRSAEEINIMLDNSQIIIAVEDDKHNLIGFSRVLTDFIFKAIIFDVIIDNAYRKENFGKLLIDSILENRDLKDIKHFELYCLDEMKPFYEKWGFSNNLENLIFMRKSTQ